MSQLHCICLLHMMNPRQIAICNDNYKFVAFSRSISKNLQLMK